MSDVAIKVDNLHKSFKLPHEKHTTLKQAALNMFSKKTNEDLKVLEGISFEIKKGEFFGIVGRNGSGKSTLLKTMAGIYEPDKGGVLINGQLTPFIELGIGFNMELTGRDNVFLNGAIFGMSRKEVEAKYDEIVKFAELERFMDQKLKNYSSGMQVRLAFSIAIQAQTEILLLDEVLAVGDGSFQEKCQKYFRDIKKTGRTIILVTHDMSNIENFCDRALLIEDGKVRSMGSPKDVASLYTLNSSRTTGKEGGDKKTDKNSDQSKNLKAGIELLGVELQSKQRVYKDTDKIIFSLKYRLTKNLEHELGMSIMKRGLSIHERNTKDIKLATKPGTYSIQWSAEAASLTGGLHYINIAAFTKQDFKLLAYLNSAAKFMVEKKTKSGFVDMKSKWKVIYEKD